MIDYPKIKYSNSIKGKIQLTNRNIELVFEVGPNIINYIVKIEFLLCYTVQIKYLQTF